MNLRGIDLFIFLPMVFLMTIGSMVLSSVAPRFFPQHFIYLGLSLAVFFLISRIDVNVFAAISPFLYIFSCILLVLTLIFGAFIRGASRWIVLGPIAFQPSEITKLLLILFFAHLVSSQKGNRRFLFALAAFVPTFLLVAAQPDLGSSIVLAAGFFGILFFGRIPLTWFFSGIAGLGALVPLAWRFLAEYQKSRILTFLSPAIDPLGTGYNSLQAMIAVGSGGLFGRGLGQGTQSQLAFLPERQTDFIFAALSEELGFLGAFLTVVAFGMVLYRMIRILAAQEDTFIQCLLGGIFFIFFSHVVVNIGMNVGILPITGIPLPFVSSGGSALVSMSAMLGIVSGVSHRLKSSPTHDILL